jgi:predicted permease
MARNTTRRGTGGLLQPITDIVFGYLKEMRLDMKYALRALIKSPGFALVGILSLGIGMGLTTMLYSSKWQVISRELPASANAKYLVMPEKPVSHYYIEQFREQKNMFTGVAALQTGVPFNINFQSVGNSKPSRVFGQLVSTDYFSVLGTQPQRGRVFSPDLDKPGDAPVVVISDRFWRNRLNSSPNAVGQTIRVNGQPATIVGITPADFNGALAINPAEVFVPITVPAAVAPELANNVLHQRNAKVFLAIICLAPGVTTESAEAALDTISRRLDEQETRTLANAKGRNVTLLSAGTMVPLPRDLKPVLIGFFVVLMGLIMTIACMNLGNMLLARGASRRKELAIRIAIGASRFRLVRQMITEGILLALMGGVAGLALAYLLSILRTKFTPPTAVPVESNFSPDWHTAMFVFVLSILCGIGFSVAPALRATGQDVTPALKEGSSLQLRGYRWFGMRNLLMGAQVTGSLTLLLITGFLVMGISLTSTIETKFNPRTMFLLSLDPVRDGYTAEKAQFLFEKLPERLKSVPDVRSVILALQTPFTIEDGDSSIQLTAEGTGGAAQVESAGFEQTVGAGYFAALNEPMLAGREFLELDQRTEPDGSKALPTVLNESAARALFGNRSPLGGRIKDDKQSYEVVGIVSDLKNGMGTSQSIMYLPVTKRNFAQPPANGMTVIVASTVGTNVLGDIRRQIADIDPNLNIFNVGTLNDFLERSRASQRFAVSTYGGIGLFGLVLSAVGLAGVTAYAVAQRRKEIGIRMALGARKGQVLLLVLREGTALVAVGTVLGFLAAFALAKALSALTNIFANSLKVGTGDVRLLIGAPLLLAGLVLLACYVPARRAVKIDPLKALRQS